MARKEMDGPAPVEQPVEVSQHVCIVNLAMGQRQFTMTDGTTVSCGPQGTSAPVLRKLIGPTLRALEKRGVIRIETAGGA